MNQSTQNQHPRQSKDTGLSLRGFWSSIGRRAFVLQLRLHHRIPWLIGDPSFAEVRRYHRDRDPSENREWAIPETEHINLDAVWLVEFYPPSTAPHLVRNIREMGSREDIGQLDIAEWISAARERWGSGAWANLGVAMRPERRKTMLVSNYVLTSMPDSVDYALMDVTQLSQGLTAVRVGFILTANASHSMETAVRRDYSTTYRRVGAGSQQFSPRFRKRDEAAAAVDEVLLQCSAWMRVRFQGAFSAGIMGGQYPSIVLLITSGVTAFETKPSRPRLLRLLGLDREFEAWEASTLPASASPPGTGLIGVDQSS